MDLVEEDALDRVRLAEVGLVLQQAVERPPSPGLSSAPAAAERHLQPEAPLPTDNSEES